MKWNMFRVMYCVFALGASSSVAQAASIAFIGFNADATDGYSIATFEDIPTGTEILFTDDEWNGAGFVDTNEADWKWTATSLVPAGAVINFTDLSNFYSAATPATVSMGTFTPIVVGGTNPGFSNSAEVIYAYTGSRATPTFLAAISSDTALNTNFVGLSGAHAIQLSSSSDGAKYAGPRMVLAPQFNSSLFLPLVANVASNWTDVGGGAGNNNFDLTPFTVPEPASWALLGLSAMAFGGRRRLIQTVA